MADIPRGNAREKNLEREIKRLRNTYSFQLGVLLTDSFARRPWMIVLLPFRFIKMNWMFFRKTEELDELNSNHNEMNKKCILLMPTSEEGMASVERISSLAKAWKEMHDGHPVIISTNDMMSKMVPKGSAIYLLPDPKGKSDISRTEWNQSCENLLKSVIDTHQPFSFIFDGPFPYRGVLNAMEIQPEINTLWLRPSTLTDPELVSRGDAFDKIISLSWDNDDDNQIQIPLLQNHQTVGPMRGKRLLIAIAYDRRSGNNRKLDGILKILKSILPDGWTLIIPENETSQYLDGFRVERWNSIGGNPELPRISAAITSDDPVIIRQLLACNVPVLSISSEKIEIKQLKSLRDESLNGGLIVLHNPDELEIKTMILRLLDDDSRSFIQIRRRIGIKSDWSDLFELLVDSI